MRSSYLDWLIKQNVSLFEGGGTYWRLYHRALIPIGFEYSDVKLRTEDAKALLKKSGAWFIRYSSNPSREKTEWWYLVCDKYDPKDISAKTRETINRGNRKCVIRQVSGDWLANNGYGCHLAAFTRYKNAKPLSEESFRNNILSTLKGPFEYWGIFVQDNLAGYCQCIVEENTVYFTVSKYDPAYLKYQITYAHINKLIQHYVVQRGMVLYSGTRSIAHETNYQDLLLKLGHRKQHCTLNIIYQPWLIIAINTLFPLCKFIDKLPDIGLFHRLQVALYQEGLRRASNAG